MVEAVAPEILVVHEALQGLAAEVVKLRYFVGQTISEIAEALADIRSPSRECPSARNSIAFEDTRTS